MYIFASTVSCGTPVDQGMSSFAGLLLRLLSFTMVSEQIAGKGFDKYGLCPLLGETFTVLTVNECKSDIECGGHRKCCETLSGNYCILPDNERVICPGGKMSAGICGNNLQCPPAYQCIFENCCPFEKAGECPLLVVPEGFELEHFSSCEHDYECVGIRKCCLTLLGMRCLLPVAKQAVSSSRYSKPARRLSYLPRMRGLKNVCLLAFVRVFYCILPWEVPHCHLVYGKSLSASEKDATDSNFAYARGKETYFGSTYYYDIYDQDANE
uniref:WAP domain-containing protein n=1 Tax=Trichuris muris TaxID=70415 RepID=A0A5S6QHR7_TRIMR